MPSLDDSTKHSNLVGLLAHQSLQTDTVEDDRVLRTTSDQWRFLVGGIAALSMFGTAPVIQERDQSTGRMLSYILLSDTSDDLVAPLTSELAVQNSLTDRVLCELGRLRTGWAGAGSVSPRNSVLNDVEAVLNLLPGSALAPIVDVDHEDGSVAVRWVRSDRSASFSLVFRGDSRATAVVATLNPPKSKSQSIAITNEAEMAAMLESHIGDFASV